MQSTLKDGHRFSDIIHCNVAEQKNGIAFLEDRSLTILQLRIYVDNGLFRFSHLQSLLKQKIQGQPGHGKEYKNLQIIDLAGGIPLGFPKYNSTWAVFLDIQKAFNRVWFYVLLYELTANNYADACIHFNNAFLSKSAFQIRVNKVLSSAQNMAAVAEWYRYRTVACFVAGSSPVPLKTRRVGQRCTLNLSRAETSSRWCGVVVRRGGCQLRCRPRHLTMVQNYVVRRQKPSCS
ncbi:uncharacterized protein TNCV_2327001 [Trichonephila clavipes]|nr:uncharacterized protein TNCV_2327001 [Trichonephila clavipes]